MAGRQPHGPRATCLRDIDVVILAGGLGTRIRPALGETPKILAPVDGRPFVDYLLDWLESFGARRIVFCLGHLGDKVRAHLAQADRDTQIEWVVESQPLGTGGALVNATPMLRTSPVLVLNGDSFVDVDFCAFAESHRASGAIASLVCTEVNDAGRFGRVTIDENSRIVRFAEKNPSSLGSGAINAGAYLFDSAFLDLVKNSCARSIEQDVFARQAPGSLHAHLGRFSFIDIGTPESLACATGVMLRSRGPA